MLKEDQMKGLLKGAIPFSMKDIIKRIVDSEHLFVLLDGLPLERHLWTVSGGGRRSALGEL